VGAFNEFKQFAINTHLENFPGSLLLKDKVPDITKVPDAVFEPYKGKTDLVFAGFPCQGFSRAGNRKAADPRNQMYTQFVRVVKLTEPRFFIGENVPGLVSMKSGPKEDDPPVLNLIIAAFKQIGYELTYNVLEATDYGVPQKRKRLLLVGWRTAVVPTFDTASFWASVSSFGAAMKMPKLRSFVTNSMECAHKIPPGNVPADFANYALPVAQDAEPTGEPHPFVVLKADATNVVYNEETYKSLLTCSKRGSPIHSEIIDLDAPSKTIICTYDHQPRLLVGLRKPDGTAYARCLLPDELKQIQGFPADFKVLGNKKEQIVQIGNAVPPPLIHSVASVLRGLATTAPVAVATATTATTVKKRVFKVVAGST
jgi:DNA (cytosine-5)-methyltransferase 1